MTRKLVLIAAAIVVVLGITGGIAFGAGVGRDDDEALTGSTRDRAHAAALEHTDGGEVVESEVADDGAAYDVEVRLADGTQVEIRLDENFNVLGRESDDDGSKNEDDAGDED